VKTFDKEKIIKIGKSAVTVFKLVLAFVYIFSTLAVAVIKILKVSFPKEYSSNLSLIISGVLTIIIYPIIIYSWHKKKYKNKNNLNTQKEKI